MSAVNLLPRRRIAGRRAERRVRRWLAVGASWCGILAAASVLILRSSSPEERAGAAARITAAEARIEAMNSEAATQKRTLAALERSKAAVQATTDHPDWSRLLASVVKVRPTGLRFTRWELVRANDALLLRVEGEAPDVAGLTSFTMRLESLGIFRRVSLLNARSAEAWAPTSFAIEGLLAEGSFQ